MAVPTSVYKYYDAHDVLIYVGVTSRGLSRNREHNSDKAWWKYVVRQEVEHFADRPAALIRERELIGHHQTPFNRAHNPHHERLRVAYLALVEIGAFSLESERKLVGGKQRLHVYGTLIDQHDQCFYTLPGDMWICKQIKPAPLSGCNVFIQGQTVGTIQRIEHEYMRSRMEFCLNEHFVGIVTATKGEALVSVQTHVKPVAVAIRSIHLDAELPRDLLRQMRDQRRESRREDRAVTATSTN